MRERVARALRATWGEKTGWETLPPKRQQPWLEMADAALAAIAQERKRWQWWKQ